MLLFDIFEILLQHAFQPEAEFKRYTSRNKDHNERCRFLNI